MLQSFTAENFRALNLSDEQLGKITVLCGANSVGKSSILKSLLLIKQIDNEGDITHKVVPLKGSLVNLGDYKNLVKNHVTTEDVTIGFSADFKPSRKTGIDFGKCDKICYELTLGFDEDDADTTQAKTKLKRFYVEVSGSEEDGDLNWLELKRMPKNRSDYVNFKNSSDSEEDYRFSGSIVTKADDESEKKTYLFTESDEIIVKSPFSDGLSIKTGALLGDDVRRAIDLFLTAIQTYSSIRAVMNKINYLGPIREIPVRYRDYGDTASQSVGIRGENAPYVLANSEKTIKSPWNVKEPDAPNETHTFVQGMDRILKDETNAWMRYLDCCDKVDCRKDNNYPGLITTKLTKSDLPCDFTDVGFGVGQVFPIIVEGLLMDNDATLFIEQPEVHLHPKMQGALTDFFIAQALSGKQFIIETHSDHIINRLVRRIVEDGLDGEALGLANLVQIYFVKKNEDTKKVEFEPVKVNPELGIVNWPSNFFDQNLREQQGIVHSAVLKKQKKLREGGQ